MSTMRELGANEIKVLRGVEDQKAFDQGLNNTTTAHDLMLLFDKMAKGDLVSHEASNEMMQVLLEQHFNEIIPALLPNTVKVAHKTGSITGVQHDSGIVIMPDGRKYVLVILSDQLKDVPAAIKAMAGVSKMVYDYMLQKGSPQ
jgi:beta-lactamase class A